jgi:acyl-CoA thioester hydrolase
MPVVIPAEARSFASLIVRFRETDLMGIVHHGNYLTYFEAARVTYLKRRAVAYDQWIDRGIHLAVAEANVRYKRPAKFDDTLVIETSIAEVTRVTVTYEYIVRRGDEVIAEGATKLACVGADMRLKRLPDDVVQSLLSPETRPDAP